MIAKAIISILSGFSFSVLGYKILHRPQIPELARYGVGGLLVLFVSYILYEDEEFSLRALFVLALAGAGVCINRFRMQLE